MKEVPSPTLETTPMVDVIFILLAFFIVVSQLKEYNLPLQLSSSETAKEIKPLPKTLLIQIDKQNQIYLRDKSISLSELEQYLKENKPQPVTIRPDKNSQSGYLIQVLDLLRKYKWHNIEVRVERKQNP